MKKNLLSLVILSLLVVNIILTSIMLFSVVGTNKKTAALVTDIAGILSLETGDADTPGSAEVSMADTKNYDIADQLTITCKRADGETKDTYCLVNVSLSMNTQDPDYATFGTPEAMKENESMVKSEVISVISSYTAEEIKLDQDAVCEEILKKVQDRFGSKFIYKVYFSNIMFG